jgi:hypothetical protein
MTNARLKGHRGIPVAIYVVGGGAIAAATWVGGNQAAAIRVIALSVVAAIAAYLWAGRDGDVGTLLRAGGDERQRRLDRDAAALSAHAMAVAAIIGTIVSIARNHGDAGGYGVMCVVGGVAYIFSLLVLKLRG